MHIVERLVAFDETQSVKGTPWWREKIFVATADERCAANARSALTHGQTDTVKNIKTSYSHVNDIAHDACTCTVKNHHDVMMEENDAKTMAVAYNTALHMSTNCIKTALHVERGREGLAC